MNITGDKYKENKWRKIWGVVLFTAALAIQILIWLFQKPSSTLAITIDSIMTALWSIIWLVNTISFIRYMVNKKKDRK